MCIPSLPVPEMPLDSPPFAAFCCKVRITSILPLGCSVASIYTGHPSAHFGFIVNPQTSPSLWEPSQNIFHTPEWCCTCRWSLPLSEGARCVVKLSKLETSSLSQNLTMYICVVDSWFFFSFFKTEKFWLFVRL